MYGSMHLDELILNITSDFLQGLVQMFKTEFPLRDLGILGTIRNSLGKVS